MRTYAGVLICLLLSAIGCSDFGAPYTPPRILPGIGMEGVRIGDSRKRAWEVLGKPDGYAFLSAIYGGGQVDIWRTGPHARLTIMYVMDYPSEEMVEPVDGLWVESPYDGTTPEGYGIGTRLEAVLSQRPDFNYLRIDSSGTGSLVYCASHRYHTITLKDSVIYSMFDGWYTPPPVGLFPFYCP